MEPVADDVDQMRLPYDHARRRQFAFAARMDWSVCRQPLESWSCFSAMQFMIWPFPGRTPGHSF
jgi:hypothetical protein